MKQEEREPLREVLRGVRQARLYLESEHSDMAQNAHDRLQVEEDRLEGVLG